MRRLKRSVGIAWLLVSLGERQKRLQSEHPDVPIITACIDEKLNENAYIVPGLGDAGDRYFGTD